MFEIGKRIKINRPDSKILNGLTGVVTDVVRSVFDRNEVLDVEVKLDKNGKTINLYPEHLTIN